MARVALLLLPLAEVRRAVRFIVLNGGRLPPERCCSLEQVVRAAVSAGIHSPVGTTCLATALVAQGMLQRHGYEAALRFGVKRDAAGEFAAHAWLERDGKVLVGGPAGEIAFYTALPEMEHLIR